MREWPPLARVPLVAAAALIVCSPPHVTRAEQRQSTTTATGTVNVRVIGARADVPITVHVESRRRGRTATIMPGSNSISIDDLGLETTHVSAIQNGLVSDIVEAILEVGHPVVDVHLELQENRAELLISGPIGVRLQTASVRPLRVGGPPFHRNGTDLEPRIPGEFVLDGIRPGTPLLIRAQDFAPVCRLATRNEVDVVQLEAGRSIDVAFPSDVTPSVMRELAALDDIPGSNCSIPFWAFEPTVDRTSPTQSAFRMTHFPASHRFRFVRLGLPDRRIYVPEFGNVVVESQ